MVNTMVLVDGGEDGEHNGVSLAETSEIFITQTGYFFGAAPFDG